MADRYPGPVRDEPLAIELHNTLYASHGQVLDGLAEDGSVVGWLAAVDDRLPPGGTGRGPTREELTALRAVVLEVLHAVVDDRWPTRGSVDALNRSSARAPRSSAARWRRGRSPVATVQFHRASRADVVISALAADVIDLITGPSRREIKACGAPGCVQLYLRDHHRREWCSASCGNRARQARYYRRSHGADDRDARSP
jgi:predicted RNA-binding Zn ribbon-like protein